MKELFDYFSDFIKGKSVYVPLTRICNFLITATITSFILRKIFADNIVNGLSDSKSIFTFLTEGGFLIPLILFITIHYILDFAISGLFLFTAEQKADKWKSEAAKIKLTEKSKSLKWLLGYYSTFKKVPAEKWAIAVYKIEKLKNRIRINFKLSVKAVIALSLYFFITLSHPGIWVYFCLLIILAGSIFLFYFSYILLDAVPVFFKTIDKEMLKILLGEEDDA